MDITLHVGAHRTGTTTFQQYMRANQGWLAQQGIGYWGPQRVRTSVLPGVFPGPLTLPGRDCQRRARGRIALQLKRGERTGLQRLIVSDPNLLDSMAQCMRARALYPATGERLARISDSFGQRIGRVVLTVRSQDLWWASVAAHLTGRGHALPSQATCAAMATSPRTWRDVVTDLACAMPGAEIIVLPFERCSDRPEAMLQPCGVLNAPRCDSADLLNRAPDIHRLRSILHERGDCPLRLGEGEGRWQPLSPAQTAALRETYADDLHWLAAGADGLATLAEIPLRPATPIPAPARGPEKGHEHDFRQRHLAQSG
ncbi:MULTISPECIES: hypothetical protein [unclassified Sulfitobacter]|uniref:hypothetical protein n=1 Tax=unclassified Sulfitobacter TaxID=196795 RepID=UPI0007C358F6|nr:MULTISPECIES: hypothetical protein [unclassified Sulfitobacter]KZX98758.1 hypothetical protein A3721_06150 [Sulfitobacter sp. HI0023]KZY23432.1 hypothetical protein A3728_00970 [Sulfitobacter sp. HI0040]KZZ67238.1 hypothetical protein A3764_15340 [Sulfitobacter sp. HI0129]